MAIDSEKVPQRARGDRSAGSVSTRQSSAVDLAAARRAARERYALIAELMKREAGVQRHFHHKPISGLAFLSQAKILAPEGVTRRQLYVLAHECGHIALHKGTAAAARPTHVQEHEAETYAHRAFARYGLDVPEQSARWARAYVGQWIMKDRAEGIPIDADALAFAMGQRSPFDPLPSVDGHPKDDFSRRIEQFTAKGVRHVARIEAATGSAVAIQPGSVTRMEPLDLMPPNGCGTCLYFEKHSNSSYSRCEAHDGYCESVRKFACRNGESWRPHPSQLRKITAVLDAAQSRPHGFWSRLGHAIIKRIGG
jgi:hypothetical protein